MIDPVYAMVRSTKSLLVPTRTATATTTIGPIPTVIPDPLPIYERIDKTGARGLWVVFVLMLLSTIGFAVVSYRAPVQRRLFALLTTFITTFATLSYFAMATGDGNSFVHIMIPDTVEHVLRQVFWARYIDWTLTTPLLLLDLAFLAGINGANILVIVVADVVMILLGLFAAFGRDGNQKWGYYAMACVAYLIIVYQLAMPGRRAVMAKGKSTSRLFIAMGVYTIIVWLFYPIIWAIGEGARKISVDSEIIAYAILDVLAKPVFGAWLLYAHRKGNAPAIEGFWSHGFANEGAIRIEEEED